MKRITLAGLGLASAVLFSTAGGNATSDENGYLGRFGGAWSGSATVQHDQGPVHVSCRIHGEPGHHSIVVQGNCGAALISRRYAADLVYNPNTGFYTGTYTGARVGPAHLSGTRKGDTMDLTITWPQPVNGDTVAKLFIENAGVGTLRITLADDGERTEFLLRQI